MRAFVRRGCPTVRTLLRRWAALAVAGALAAMLALGVYASGDRVTGPTTPGGE
jgi:hypothetical protein